MVEVRDRGVRATVPDRRATMPRHAPRHAARSARLPRQAAAALLSLALVVTVVTRTSSAAFTATTAADGGSVTLGQLALGTDAATTLFGVSGLKPGEAVTRCVTVTYTGDLVGADVTTLRLYASSSLTDVAGAAGSLTVDVDRGAGALDAACTGFVESAPDLAVETLATFAARTGFATGVDTGWSPSATPASVSFRITLSVAAGAADALQGAVVSDLGFTWEVQST